MNNHFGQIRRGRKFDQVLDGARQIFMSDGFEGANVDDIAKAAGVSKATLYSYFPDKRLLFVEVARHECLRQSQEAVDNIDLSAPPRHVLGQAGRHFLRFVTSKLGQQIFRICMAESERFPEIGREFYRSGPDVMQAEMGIYFEAAIARGELKIDDLTLAAFQFAEMCKAEIWMKIMFKVIDDISEAEIDRIVESAVETFLARYAT